MEEIQCIFCNINSDEIVIEENGYKGRKCPKCGLIFISPRPSFDEISNMYYLDQSHISAESHISGNFIKRLYAKNNLKIIMNFMKKGSMLEIGAGAGYFLDEARKKGFKVYGIELNGIQTDFITNNLGIPCEKLPLSSSSFGENMFDIIYHCDVLSHFYDPITEFKKINNKLKKNGIVVFETGNFGEMNKKYYKYIERFQYPDHLFFFSENSLRELLARTGFAFIGIYRFSMSPQLKIPKVIEIIKTLVKFSRKNKNIIKKTIHKNIISKSPYNHKEELTFKKLIHYYYIYFLRYKIGYIMPKNGRPQTIIVIGQKKEIL